MNAEGAKRTRKGIRQVRGDRGNCRSGGVAETLHVGKVMPVTDKC